MFASRKPATAARRLGTPPALQIAPLLGRLRRDQSGNVAMLFGLSLIPLVALIGLAVDFGRVYSVTSHTQVALDSAALAAGRIGLTDKVDTVNKASAAATAFFNQSKPKDVVSSVLQFSPNSANTQFTVTATSWVKTPFLSVLYSLFHKGGSQGAPAVCASNGFGCVTFTSTATAALCPSAACTGGGGGSNVELALMLDVTGSMCDPCTKIEALKKAVAGDPAVQGDEGLLGIVLWEDQSEYTSRVALVPFAEAVNVGKTLAPLVRGTVTSNTQNGSGSNAPQAFTTSSALNDTTNQPTKKWIRYNKASGGGTNTWLISSKCVTERIGADKNTDAAPAGTSTYVGKGYFGANQSSAAPQQDDTSCGVANHTDPEINLIQPLSGDKEMLRSRVKQKLATSGSTAGQLGTAWAWYMLSPKWNTVLQQAFPSSSPAAPYSDMAIKNSRGMPKLRKIAVLMTDGDYNINYCKGVEAKNSDQSPDINCNSENGKALAQATALCSAMKAPIGGASIEVYTIGFQVSSASRTFLTNCATDASHYYDATTDVALQAAFKDIALKIANIRLTN